VYYVHYNAVINGVCGSTGIPASNPRRLRDGREAKEEPVCAPAALLCAARRCSSMFVWRPAMRRLKLSLFQSPGDVLMGTAAVRDLHQAHPGKFQTDVRTSTEALWEHNPYITKLSESDREVQTIEMHYPLIHQSNQRPYHFIHGYVQ
jgi:hypothetical protein